MPINDVQQTNRQHAVPQNIMDVEFKIIGDLTMRQFFYLLIFGGFAYWAFSVYNGFLKWPLVFGLVMGGLAFAFLPVEERGLDQWIVNAIRAVYKDTQYIWRKTPEIPPAFSFENMNVVKQEIITLTPTSSRRKLEEFLETQGRGQEEDPLDIPEVSYIKKVRSAFQYSSATAVDEEIEEGTPVFPSYSGPITPPTPLPMPPLPPVEEYFEEPVEESPKPEERFEQYSEPPREAPAPPPFIPELEPEPAPFKEPVPEQKYIPLPPLEPVPDVEQDVEQTIQPQYVPEPEPRPESAPLPEPVQTVPQPEPLETPDTPHEDILGPASAVSRPIKLPRLPHIPKPLLPPQEEIQAEEASNIDFLTPLTPDQHSGRKFTSLLPKQGEIVLPIRGETVIQTSEQNEIDDDIEEKAEQLRKLLAHIREAENIPPTKIEHTVKESTVDIQPGEEAVNQFSMQKMLEEMERNRTRAMDQAAERRARIEPKVIEVPLREEKPQPKPDIRQPEVHIIGDIKKPEDRQTLPSAPQPAPVAAKPVEPMMPPPPPPPAPPSPHVARTDAIPDFQGAPGVTSGTDTTAQEWKKAQNTGPHAVAPTYAKIKALSSIPNIVSGIVLSPDDRTLENIVLIIKNGKDEPVRALKSNSMGQFSISTPLANGTYYIETDKSNRTQHTFDIIKIVAKGEFIPPIEIKGYN